MKGPASCAAGVVFNERPVLTTPTPVGVGSEIVVGPGNDFLMGGFASARKPGDSLDPSAGTLITTKGIARASLGEELADALVASADRIAAAQDAVFIRDW